MRTDFAQLRCLPDLLFPRRCPFCGSLLGPDALQGTVCPACVPEEMRLQHIPARLPEGEHDFYAVREAAAAYYYEDIVRTAVLRCKRGGCFWYARELADHCMEDIQFLNDKYDDTLIERLKSVLGIEFVRLTYTEGIKILEESGQQFEYPVKWGVDLQSEHERYLVEKHFKKPVILTDYPKEIKAFYMKQNEDGKTVRGTDVLFPKIGEIIGGSERESSLEKLEKRIDELGMSRKNLEWYIDTRRFGTVPHSGFGLGFERLLLFVTGMSNIRDVIPFPRTPRNADF